jgi:hypothetical protein
VGIVVPLSRLLRGMRAPLRTTANRIAALLALNTPPSPALPL